MASAVPVHTTLEPLRRSRGMTQADVARRLGVTPAQVSRWESGSRNPSADQQAQLDSLLALGEPVEGERSPLYAVGELHEGVIALPLTTDGRMPVFERPWIAEIPARLLSEGGVPAVVVPIWRSAAVLQLLNSGRPRRNLWRVDTARSEPSVAKAVAEVILGLVPTFSDIRAQRKQARRGRRRD